MVDYLTYHNDTNHSINNMHDGLLNLPQQYQPSINNMHGGLLNLPQQYQELYKQHALWIT